jgi:MFS family permease
MEVTANETKASGRPPGSVPRSLLPDLGMAYSYSRMNRQHREPLFTARFFVMCGFNFAYFLSVLQLLPTAPYRILELGGSEIAAGMFLGFGTYASAFSAPITGSLADRFGRRRMMIVCSLALSALAAAYAVSHDYRVMVGLALVRGCLQSGLLCSSSAYMTDFMPAARRGEGLGYWDLSTMLAVALAPSLGFWLYHRGGWMWLCTSVGILNLVTTAIALQLVDVEAREPARRVFLGKHLIEWPVLALSMTLFLYSFGYGGTTSFAALYADARHVVPKEIFLTTYGIAVLCTRPFLVPLGDRIGHRRVFLPCLVLIVLGLALLAASGSRIGIIMAAAVFGTGFGAAYPVFAAYVMRHVAASRRGAAFGSIHAAFDTGMGTGSIATGWIVHGHGFEGAFAVAAILAAMAIPFFLFMERRVLGGASATPPA